MNDSTPCPVCGGMTPQFCHPTDGSDPRTNLEAAIATERSLPLHPRVRDAVGTRVGWVHARVVALELEESIEAIAAEFGTLHDYGLATVIGSGEALSARWDSRRLVQPDLPEGWTCTIVYGQPTPRIEYQLTTPTEHPVTLTVLFPMSEPEAWVTADAADLSPDRTARLVDGRLVGMNMTSVGYFSLLRLACGPALESIVQEIVDGSTPSRVGAVADLSDYRRFYADNPSELGEHNPEL